MLTVHYSNLVEQNPTGIFLLSRQLNPYFLNIQRQALTIDAGVVAADKTRTPAHSFHVKALSLLLAGLAHNLARVALQHLHDWLTPQLLLQNSGGYSPLKNQSLSR